MAVTRCVYDELADDMIVFATLPPSYIMNLGYPDPAREVCHSEARVHIGPDLTDSQ